MIQQVSVFLENKSGRLAELASTLGDAGIDMHALVIADTSEFGVVRIICDNPTRAKALLDEAGFGASLTNVIAVEIPNRAGGLASLLHTLDGSGMNVEYAYVFVEPGGGGAIDVLKVDADAEAVLRQAGFRLLAPSDVYASDAS